jgi:outer membrane protein TolC
MKLILLSAVVSLIAICANAQTRNLDYFIAEAQINSPLINKSKNNNKIIQLDIKQIKIILTKPQINVEANLLFAPIISHDNGNQLQLISAGAANYTGYDLSYSDGGQYQARVTVTQPLLMRERQKVYSQKADVATQLNENNIKLTQHELELLVSHQYLLCLKAKKQSDISIALIEQLRSQVNTMKKLVKNAIYKQTDLLSMQIELENCEIELQNYNARYKNNLLDLNLLCGINDTTLVEIEDVNYILKPNTVFQSQFLTSYKLDSLNLVAELSVFDQKYKPQVSLFANAGMNAIYTPAFNRFGFAAGVNFSWNIFDGNQKKIVHDKAFINMQMLDFDKQYFVRQYNINKNKYLTEIELVNNQLKIVKKQIEEYRELVDLYAFQLSQAQVSAMDYKNLVRDISVKKQELLLLKMQSQALIISYNYWNY